jgi:hypothetical protein
MLVPHFIFDLLWTGRGSSISSVALLGFRELQQIEKPGSNVFSAKLSLQLMKDYAKHVYEAMALQLSTLLS